MYFTNFLKGFNFSDIIDIRTNSTNNDLQNTKVNNTKERTYGSKKYDNEFHRHNTDAKFYGLGNHIDYYA